jgi:RNA polymerase sigma factor for flagellar operon FliA
VRNGARQTGRWSILPQQLKAQRDALILEHMPLVRSIAMRIREGVPPSVELDDMIHAGVFGLMDAAAKFRSDMLVDFRHYAKHRIRGAILDSLRALDWCSRDARRAQRTANDAIRSVSQKLQRVPSEAELADHLGIPVTAWRELAERLQNAGPVSTSGGPEGAPIPEPVDTASAAADQVCALSQLRSAVREAMSCLPERYKTVITLYYSGEQTMAEIGTVLGVNESRVSQIHKNAIQKLRAVLRDRGIRDSAAFEVLPSRGWARRSSQVLQPSVAA